MLLYEHRKTETTLYKGQKIARGIESHHFQNPSDVCLSSQLPSIQHFPTILVNHS